MYFVLLFLLLLLCIILIYVHPSFCVSMSMVCYTCTLSMLCHACTRMIIIVTELMWGLHWLPIRVRIQYKILLLVYKAFTNSSPTYLADMMTSCNPVRSTRSSHKVHILVVPHQKSNKYSEKAFAVVGPRLWNELLTDELRGCDSVDTFKKKLKIMLFKKHY